MRNLFFGVLVGALAIAGVTAAQTSNPAPEVAERLCDLEEVAGIGPYDECVPPPTTTTTAPPTTITAPPTTTTTVPPTTTTLPPATGFSADFTDPADLALFDLGVFHRDDSLGAQDQWPGDHDLDCGPPSTQRTVTKAGGVDEMVYLCREHLMTSIGDASGYDIVSFTPIQEFDDITTIQWDQNITNLGGDNSRQFTEVKVIPADVFDPQNLPCAIEWLPCGTDSNGALGAVSVSTAFMSRTINNGSSYESTEQWTKPWMYPDDPALDSKMIRRTHYLIDNGDGTLTFGTEIDPAQPPATSTCGGDCGLSADGAYYEITRPGSFPEGPVRVVFADHAYTPTKDPLSGFTWHWDDIVID